MSANGANCPIEVKQFLDRIDDPKLRKSYRVFFVQLGHGGPTVEMSITEESWPLVKAAVLAALLAN